MNRILSGLTAGAVAVSLAAGAAVPVLAAPLPLIKEPAAQNPVQQVQYDGYWKKRFPSRINRENDRYRVMRRGDDYYLNGHRGYRDYRPGYRRHNDFWFPAGAFIAGAIIGGALNQPRYVAPRYAQPAYGNAHVQWCYDRYRSYRASDNTFQPYNGPRRQCYSPY
ncbi:BA14K family protein [Aminobacter sp. HY435]|uniref:BA14K family protein n=1 Tax=Aminobacter sp. HY435 TaxID=2970917 RepID=UPI0022B9B7C2|nr:BA14K family protein [Aminobacter sp. HY435]